MLEPLPFTIEDIEDCSLIYTGRKIGYFEYHLIKDTMQSSKDESIIRFELKSLEPSEDNFEVQISIEDNNYFINSSNFEGTDLYPLRCFKDEDNNFLFTKNFADEVLYLEISLINE